MTLILLPLLLSGTSGAEKPVVEGEPEKLPVGGDGEGLVEGQAENFVEIDGGLGDDDNFVMIDDPASPAGAFIPTDETRTQGLAKSASKWGSPPTSFYAGGSNNDVETPAGSLPETTNYVAPQEMPLISNTKENAYAHEISGYQNELSRILQMAMQMPEHKAALTEKLGADFDPTTLVDGHVGSDDLKALKAFVEVFAPETSLQTSWGSEGYSKAVIAQLGIVSAQVDEALSYDLSELDGTLSLADSAYEADVDADLYEAASSNSDLPIGNQDHLTDVGEDECDWEVDARPISAQPPDLSVECGLDVAAIQQKYEGTAYGSGRGQYNCVTFMERILKDAGYNLDHQQLMCIPGKGGLEASYVRSDASLQGAPRALIDAGLGVSVDPSTPMPVGTVVQYWYYDRGGNLRGHAGIVAKTYSDGSVDLYGAHASSGEVTTKHVNLSASRVDSVYAAYPKPAEPRLT